MNRENQAIPKRAVIRDRIARFLLLCGSLGSVSLVIIIAQRLSDDALSLAMGVGIGVIAILIPLILVGIIGYLIVRWTEARAAIKHSGQQPYSQPPVLIVNPSASDSGYRPQLPAWHDGGAELSRQQRTFTVIGGED